MVRMASCNPRYCLPWRLSLWVCLLISFQVSGSQQSTAVYPDNPLAERDVLCVSDDGVTCLESAELGKRWEALAGVNTFEVLYTADAVLVGSTTGLHALSPADGSSRWQWRGDAHVFSPAVGGEVAYATDRTGRIAALDLQDGRVIWEKELNGWLYTPALLEDRLITGGSGGVVYALHRGTGETLWTRRLDQELVFRPVAVPGGVVVTTFKGSVLLVDGDGELVWEERDAAPSFSPAAADDLLVFGGMDGVLRARDARTGRLRWRVELSGALSVPARIRAGEVAIVTPDGALLILDAADGSRLARVPLPGTPLGRPVYSGDHGWRVLQRDAGIFSWVGASR